MNKILAVSQELADKYPKYIEIPEAMFYALLGFSIVFLGIAFLILIVWAVGKFMQKVNLLYAQMYNREEKRCGVLFRNRYQTEPIYDIKYLLNCIKYIHENPVKAKICNNAEEYLYSSYREYLRDSWLIDKEYLFSLIGKEAFIAFHSEPSNDKCLDIEENNRIQYTDEQAKKIIEKVSKCSTVTEFQALDKEKRNRYLTILRKNGLSIRQISRLTGVSFSIVKRV